MQQCKHAQATLGDFTIVCNQNKGLEPAKLCGFPAAASLQWWSARGPPPPGRDCRTLGELIRALILFVNKLKEKHDHEMAMNRARPKVGINNPKYDAWIEHRDPQKLSSRHSPNIRCWTPAGLSDACISFTKCKEKRARSS